MPTVPRITVEVVRRSYSKLAAGSPTTSTSSAVTLFYQGLCAAGATPGGADRLPSRPWQDLVEGCGCKARRNP